MNSSIDRLTRPTAKTSRRAPRQRLSPPAEGAASRGAARLEARAKEQASRGLWAEAARTLKQASRERPEELRWWLQIARWQAKAGEPQDAIRTLRDALRWNILVAEATGDDARQDAILALWVALAEAQMEAGAWDECILSCRALLRLDAQHHQGHEILATALLYKGEVEAAAETLEALLHLSPRDPLHRLKLATLLNLQGRLGDAARQFERVALCHPDTMYAREASESLESLDAMQMEQLVSNEWSHRARRDLDAAMREGGFHLSSRARDTVRHLLWNGRAPERAESFAPRIH